jgi:ribosomal protein S18 acetylase RimI-like enzyme
VTAQPIVRVRGATVADAADVATGIHELVIELGGSDRSVTALQEAARALIENADAGILMVAEAEAEYRQQCVGLLAASWVFAINLLGRYATIQNLWVHRDWRSQAVGRHLMQAFLELAKQQGAIRIEVGLPDEDFLHVEVSEAFYEANGFERMGPRMLRVW